jgi:hypothetical protein
MVHPGTSAGTKILDAITIAQILQKKHKTAKADRACSPGMIHAITIAQILQKKDKIAKADRACSPGMDNLVVLQKERHFL